MLRVEMFCIVTVSPTSIKYKVSEPGVWKSRGPHKEGIFSLRGEDRLQKRSPCCGTLQRELVGGQGLPILNLGNKCMAKKPKVRPHLTAMCYHITVT